MSKTALPGKPLSIMRDVGWIVHANLLDRARELDVDFSYGRFEALVGRIERLRYVERVEDAHMFWASINPDTCNHNVAARRVAAVLAKIERLLIQYRKRQVT